MAYCFFGFDQGPWGDAFFERPQRPRVNYGKGRGITKPAVRRGKRRR